MINIYNYILAKGILTLEHQEELHVKRGLSYESIKNNKFISGGKYLLEIETELIAKFSQELLLESGVCINNGKGLTITPILLQNKIIIPYFRGEDCILLRPHKLGLKGTSCEIYKPYGEINRDCIITEGEFKAAAGQQLGVSTIAIPGISSFSEQYFPKLVEFLNNYQVKNICIIFDNECKDNPAYKNYKENPSDRHDTEFYAFYMAKMLDKEGFRTQVGIIPDSWRINGKIDLDGMLALGKTKQDLSNIIINSESPKQYFESLSKEVQHIINRKMKRKYFRSHIRIEFGKYVALRKRGKTEWDEIISNFTIKILATHETQEGIIREIQFTNEFGESFPCKAITAEDMGGSDGFTCFCYSHGNFTWRGTKEDLANIWEGLFLEDDGRHIIEPDHVGYLESENLWLFGNVAISNDGLKELRCDKNHIFWLDKKGIKPVSLGVTSGKTEISEGIPYLSSTEVSIQEIKEKLSATIGEIEACKCIGWCNAVAYMETVFNNYGCFPFLFITGRTGSGKSTVAEWLNCFFGIEEAGKSISQTTTVATQRALAYYSNLPVFLDEYRNTDDIIRKTGFLRNVYNRQSSGKGIKSSFGIREAKVRGTLIIAGEETPNDNAILNRSILIEIIKKNRMCNHYDWFMKNKNKFSYHLYNILRRRDEKFFEKVLLEARNYLVQHCGIDDRTAVNHAAITAGYAISFGEQDQKFAASIILEAKKTNTEYQKDNLINQFVSDLQVLVSKGDIKQEDYFMSEDEKIYIYFQGLYNIWASDCKKRGKEVFKESSLRGYFKEEESFIGYPIKKRIKGFSRNCIVLSEDLINEDILDLVSLKEVD